jgi:hypothetical protein
VRPEESMRAVSILVLTPMVMVAIRIRPRTRAPWMLSVRKEILKPPRAKWGGFVSGIAGDIWKGVVRQTGVDRRDDAFYDDDR